MDINKLKSVKRGKFDQLRYDDNPIEIPFKNVKIVRDTKPTKADRCANDNYTRIDITHANGNKGDLLMIHNVIKAKVLPEFSPLKYAAENGSWDDIVCKVKTKRYLAAGDIVDVVLSPGAFGVFGWCLTATIE